MNSVEILRNSSSSLIGRNALIDRSSAVLQYCCMTAVAVSKRGTITLPPEIRRQLGLESTDHPMMLVELRDGGVFLHPASAVPVRDIPLDQMIQWIAEDEQGAEAFWKKAGAKASAKRRTPRTQSKSQ